MEPFVIIALDQQGASRVIGPFDTADEARQFVNDHLAMPSGQEIDTTIEPMVAPADYLAS